MKFGPLLVKPGAVVSALVGVGYNLPSKPLRLGFSAQSVHTGVASQEGGVSEVPSRERLVLNSVFSISYLMRNDIMLAGSYNDQTLLGPARNTALERLFSLQIQKRWSL